MRYSFALLAVALAGCSYGNDANKPPTSDGLPPVPISRTDDGKSPQPPQPATASNPTAATDVNTWPEPFVPVQSVLCTRTATKAATSTMRPAADAPKFGQLTVGDKVQLAARTADGWVGFEPGTAQAANVGIFRLRWVRAAEAFAPGDSCSLLPLVTAPPAGCLLMAARATPVRQQPAAGATLLSTIPAGSYAQVVKPAASKPGGWVEVVVPGRTAPGYVAGADVNFSGPCH